MPDRFLILVLALGAGFVLLGVYAWYRKRFGPQVERLAVDDLGLELMEGCCAFVVFTSPGCTPCKAALRVAQSAAAAGDGLTEVRTVDASARPELAIRYEVRTIPTVFLITASGHVVERWRDVPTLADAQRALRSV